ncbi:winged helix DNA-binding protein [Methanonatronarchaeum sp. AMET-Sl]|uniref:winged helix DNA-binding protein n=1 Tax=Methanonatronarchaeum sp. AMET-Sl TaxID=3037654 RepID=UPI00244DC8EF|nr:winged helix DNA-binding protein [Methanonatronarchaeum sp. AMET-Sl]WGI18128.1 winged helix DNA-binding protein [Methanonatronarchaeum sp. AMET-Sl]
MKILLTVYHDGETYPTKVSHRTEGSYSHIVKTISELEELGLLKSEVLGRRKVVCLTDEGREVAEMISDILDISDNNQVDDVGDEKVQGILDKVEMIYRQELKGKDEISSDKARNLGKRLGPYKRELSKLEGEVNDDLLVEAKNRVDEVMELKNQLSK